MTNISNLTTLEKAQPNTALVLTATAALLTLVPVAAHQLGFLDHLPDPPGRVFDSDRITESKAAHPLGVPDSLPGLASYGMTLALIGLAKKHPALRGVLAFKLCADGSLAAFNVVRQVVSFRSLCSWCTGTAICTAAMLVAGREIIGDEANHLLTLRQDLNQE
jgi:uncharacterized membrane protein